MTNKNNLILTLIIILASQIVSAKVIFVPDDFKTIQSAIDFASPRDKIIVKDGVYYENVIVNKKITIVSENGSTKTIIFAKDVHKEVFNITTDHVTISGFTIKGAKGERFYIHKECYPNE